MTFDTFCLFQSMRKTVPFTPWMPAFLPGGVPPKLVGPKPQTANARAKPMTAFMVRNLPGDLAIPSSATNARGTRPGACEHHPHAPSSQLECKLGKRGGKFA